MEEREKMLFVTDLDGTILPKGGEIHPDDWRAFAALKAAGHHTAIATGRLYHAAWKVIPADFPADYVVFSMGNGVADWRNREIVSLRSISRDRVRRVVELFRRHRINFIIFPNPPYSERIFYRRFTAHPDFETLTDRYLDTRTVFEDMDQLPGEAGQVLAMFDSPEAFDGMAARIQGVQVNRSTSPIDQHTLWMELFAPGVDKASGLEWILRKHGLDLSRVVAFGNDYNDLAMLEYAGRAYVVDNAPASLKGLFRPAPPVTEQGVARILERDFSEWVPVSE